MSTISYPLEFEDEMAARAPSPSNSDISDSTLPLSESCYTQIGRDDTQLPVIDGTTHDSQVYTLIPTDWPHQAVPGLLLPLLVQVQTTSPDFEFPDIQLALSLTNSPTGGILEVKELCEGPNKERWACFSNIQLPVGYSSLELQLYKDKPDVLSRLSVPIFILDPDPSKITIIYDV